MWPAAGVDAQPHRNDVALSRLSPPAWHSRMRTQRSYGHTPSAPAHWTAVRVERSRGILLPEAEGRRKLRAAAEVSAERARWTLPVPGSSRFSQTGRHVLVTEGKGKGASMRRVVCVEGAAAPLLAHAGVEAGLVIHTAGAS